MIYSDLLKISTRCVRILTLTGCALGFTSLLGCGGLDDLGFRFDPGAYKQGELARPTVAQSAPKYEGFFQKSESYWILGCPSAPDLVTNTPCLWAGPLACKGATVGYKSNHKVVEVNINEICAGINKFNVGWDERGPLQVISDVIDDGE